MCVDQNNKECHYKFKISSNNKFVRAFGQLWLINSDDNFILFIVNFRPYQCICTHNSLKVINNIAINPKYNPDLCSKSRIKSLNFAKVFIILFRGNVTTKKQNGHSFWCFVGHAKLSLSLIPTPTNQFCNDDNWNRWECSINGFWGHLPNPLHVVQAPFLLEPLPPIPSNCFYYNILIVTLMEWGQSFVERTLDSLTCIEHTIPGGVFVNSDPIDCRIRCSKIYRKRLWMGMWSV